MSSMSAVADTAVALGPPGPGEDPSAPEVSVVLPCLNEAETLGACIDKASRALHEHRIAGEIIVADNGSTDGSVEIARQRGAIVVDVPAKGYGSALMGGIAAARGRYVVMGDADDSYDFMELPKFVERLREGFDLVQGCRLPSGGGTIHPGAMPFLHRWWGNPMFSLMVRGMFHAPIHDVYCGMRAFSKTLYVRLDQRCTGMEFATEMIIKATLFGGRIAEVPITLHRDGRLTRLPHLKTFRDGWRTLRFFLMCSPRWLFLLPGSALVAGGLVAYAGIISGVGGRLGTPAAEVMASVAILCGYQALLFALFAKTFAITEGILPPDPRLDHFYKLMNLEKGLAAGVVAFLLGAGVLTLAPADRLVPASTLIVLGFQTIVSSFFVSMLGLLRK